MIEIKRAGFTLVELIVVVVILSILGAIGFVSYSSSLVNVRDTTRISNIQAIHDSIINYAKKNGGPLPDNPVRITDGSKTIGHQGEAGLTVLETIDFDYKKGLDPKDRVPYTYYIDASKKYFQIMAFLEDDNNTANIASHIFNQSYANTPDYSSRFSVTHGDKLGIIVNETNNIPLTSEQAGTLDVSGAPSGYSIIFDTDTQTRPNNPGFDSSAYANTVRNGGIVANCMTLDDKKNLVTDQDYIFSGSGVIVQSCGKGAIAGIPVVIGNKFSSPVIGNVPVLTLNGASNINLFVGDSYSELSATANDSEDGDITVNILTAGDTVNTSLAGTYSVTYDVTDSDSNMASQITRTVNVTAPTPFVSRWTFPSNNYSFTIPLKTEPGVTLDYNFTIDWGDGSPISTITSYSDSDKTHTYTTAGSYTITMSGLIEGFENDGTHKDQLVEVVDFGNIGWKDLSEAFQNNTALVAFAGGDTSNVNDMRSMFSNSQFVNPEVSNWDVSNVTNISNMFNNADSFNQPLNNWDVSNVTNMGTIFTSNNMFNQPLDNWDTSNVTRMFGMFNNASSFNQPLDNWNTSNVTNMVFMFNNADSFNQPLDNWDTSNVTNMEAMFQNTDVFNQDISSWDVSSVTNMRNMFSFTDSFNQNISGWNVSNVASMYQMFYNTDSFNQDISGWDVSGTTNMHEMFRDSDVFDQDISGWTVTGVSGITNCLGFSTNTSASWITAEKPVFTNCSSGY